MRLFRRIFSLRKIYYTLIIIPIITLILGYLYSIVSVRKDLFPYPYIKAIYAEIFNNYPVAELHEQVQKNIARNSSAKNNPDTENSDGPLNLNDLVQTGRVIESLTVPFLARSIDMNSMTEFGYPLIKGSGGGVCKTGESLVLMGSQGNGGLIDLNTHNVTDRISLSDIENLKGGKVFDVRDVVCGDKKNLNQIYVVYQSIHHDAEDPAAQYQTSVGRIDVRNFKNESLTNIWSSGLIGPNYAGRLVFLADNKALLTFSDSEPYGKRQNNGLFRPEDPDLLIGKVMSLDLSSGEHEIYSKGHRNPQGLFVTPEGEVYETEHGPKGGDELNLIVQGGDYGWPFESHGVNYGSYRWKHGDAGRHNNFNQPIFSWVPSIAISNLLKVRNFHPSWAGDFLIASLKAQSLYRMRLDESYRVKFVEQIWLGSRIRDLEEIDDSHIVLWTDDSKLIFMSVASKFAEGDKRTATSVLLGPLKECSKCHHFEMTNETHLAPSLRMIFSKSIAGDNFKYSDALLAKEGKWTPERLKQFIMDPQAFAPGSSMAYHVESEAEADEVVELLIKVDKMGQ
mgnify:CR=1 FL=1